jgi:dipeptidase
MQLKQTILAVSTGLALASLSMGSLACTTLIVGKNVSETGRVMVGHTEDADGRVLHQEFFYPAQKHEAGADPLVAEPGRAVVPNVPETLDTYWSNMLDMTGSSFD